VGADLFIPDASGVLFMELVEVDVVILRRGIKGNRDRDEAEGYHGFVSNGHKITSGVVSRERAGSM
jgi:hypothetical protein